MIKKKALFSTTGALLVAVLLIAFKPGAKQQTPQIITQNDAHSFAVVELFTSEGCSSCPPADQLLGNILQNARQNNKNVYALAFHVDYWNNLGWRDIYSRSDYSKRQRNYARALNSSVYTPQMIVNGHDQFVGSNSGHARSSINNNLSKPAAATVTLKKVERASQDHVQVQYKVSGFSSPSVLNVAVVERGIVRHIKRGENNGLTMHHENVVRAFNTIKLDQSEGETTLNIPQNLNSEQASVIAYVQNPDTKEIMGANRKDLAAVMDH